MTDTCQPQAPQSARCQPCTAIPNDSCTAIPNDSCTAIPNDSCAGFSLVAQALSTQCPLIEDELVIPRGTTLKKAERLLLTAALRWSGGRRATMAQLLGVSRRTLYNKLSKMDTP